MKRRLDIIRWAALAVLAAAGWFNYRAMISYTMIMFSEPLEDMSHGWVVPFVSLYVMWRQRKALRAAAGGPCARGVLWVTAFLVVAWFGGRGAQSRLEQISLIGLIWAIPYAFWGRRMERLMRFPAAYLAFTIPVSSYVDFFTIHLRIFSSALATGLLNGVGILVERSGTALYSHVPGAEFKVDVADPCSGVRSLFAMMALTAAYAFFTQKGAGRKFLLFCCSVPIAMIGNMVRIISICLIAAWFGQEVATGYYHDYSGYVVFLVGVLLMLKAGDLLHVYGDRLGRHLRLFRRPADAGPEEASAVVPTDVRGGYGVVTGVVALVLSVFVGNVMVPRPTYDPAAFVASALPEKAGEFTSDVPWFCHHHQCLETVEERELKRAGQTGEGGFVCPSCGGALHGASLGETADLPRDTVILKRNYRSPDGLRYSVSVVIGGRSRGSIHRPELCLPAQGFAMLDAGRLELAVGRGRPLTVRKISAARAGGNSLSIVYWFLSRDRESCSHTERILLDVWDRSIHNRINRWVMVAINAGSGLETAEEIERFASFLSALYPQVVTR